MPKELVEVVRCKDCLHRPQWNKTVLAPPNYWGDWEAEVDWTCPLIDKNDLYDSWYMDDDFFCPKGENREDIEKRLAALEASPYGKANAIIKPSPDGPKVIMEIDMLRALLKNSAN